MPFSPSQSTAHCASKSTAHSASNNPQASLVGGFYLTGRVTPRLHRLQSNAACHAVPPPRTTAGAPPKTHNSNAEAPKSFYQACHKCSSPPGHPTMSSSARRRLQQGARGKDAEADSHCLLCKKGNPGPQAYTLWPLRKLCPNASRLQSRDQSSFYAAAGLKRDSDATNKRDNALALCPASQMERAQPTNRVQCPKP